MEIKKIDIPQSTAIDVSVLWGGINDNVLAAKINELIDVVNKQQDILRQIGEWGSRKGEFLWCDTLTEFNPEKPQKETFVSIDEALKNAEKMISTANRYYLYVKYKHLIGKLCKFKWGQGCYYGILTNIKRKPTELPFESNGRAFSNCEPVKPDDDIIYKGGDNE